jgi:nucleoside-diphosphate-sugar epimerase
MHKLLRFLDRSPVFPIFGPGTNLWQPVYYKDLAQGILSVLQESKAIHRSYDLPGAASLEYVDLVRTSAGALGRDPRIIRLPLEPARRALRLAELVRLPLPVKSEQVMRLNEDKAYPYEEARRDLGYAPRAFPEGIALEVARLREIGLLRTD